MQLANERCDDLPQRTQKKERKGIPNVRDIQQPNLLRPRCMDEWRTIGTVEVCKKVKKVIFVKGVQYMFIFGKGGRRGLRRWNKYEQPLTNSPEAEASRAIIVLYAWLEALESYYWVRPSVADIR